MAARLDYPTDAEHKLTLHTEINHRHNRSHNDTISHDTLMGAGSATSPGIMFDSKYQKKQVTDEYCNG
jgi:hypothetical protein